MDVSAVLDRVEYLRNLDPQALIERRRIQYIMDGGVDGIMAVMAWDMGKGASAASRQKITSTYGVDMPTVNLLASGLDRLSQVVGRAPTLKAPFADDEKIRERYERRSDIVRGWDYLQRRELQYPQVGRWLPGYAFCAWVIKQKRDPDGAWYPVAELRDPYDVYPGWFGADQQPEECAIIRKVPLKALKSAYPEVFEDGTIEQELTKRRGTRTQGDQFRGAVDLRQSSWEGKRNGVEVAEYHHADGIEVVIPEVATTLSHIPNPLDSGPAFVFAKKFSFNRNQSHYHHVIGLMSMMAKMNILGLIASEDSVFRETNIIGELESGEYERGRFATNIFSEGARIEKPSGDLPQAVWAQIDRLERQLRIGAAYDVSQDAISPNSYATGQAIRELGGSMVNQVREYHTALRHADERVDSKRLEWADKLWKGKRRKVYDVSGKVTSYRPSKDIAGDYRTRRVYGAMATWDDNAKAIVGLQYLQAQVIDLETMQENVDGDLNAALINKRNSARRAEETLMARLSARAEQDPRADAALVEIMVKPENKLEILTKYFTPQEPEMSPEEEQMMMAAQPGGGMPQGPPPDIQTVLQQVETGAEPSAGVQTVGRLA